MMFGDFENGEHDSTMQWKILTRNALMYFDSKTLQFAFDIATTKIYFVCQ